LSSGSVVVPAHSKSFKDCTYDGGVPYTEVGVIVVIDDGVVYDLVPELSTRWKRQSCWSEEEEKEKEDSSARWRSLRLIAEEREDVAAEEVVVEAGGVVRWEERENLA